jgi:hypothetical protein
MPSYFASLYTGPISFLGIAGLASFLVLLILRFLRAEVEPPHFGVLLQAFFCAYWILAFLSLYVVFFVMLQWCGAGADFGCGYQKRYELPLYPFIALTLFLFSIDCVSRLAERFYRDKGVRILLFFFLVCCQSVCCYYTYRGMLQTIHSRYFVSAGSEKSHS